MKRHNLVRTLAMASSAAVLLTSLGTAQASYTTYRQSCPSSVGVPQLSAGAPIAGFTWTLTVTGLRPNTAGSLIYALSDSTFGGNPLPLDLGFMGAPGCFLNVNSDPAAGGFAYSVPADATGSAVLAFGIPNAAGVLGFTFYNQYVSLDAPAGRVLPITTTNAGHGVVGMVGVPNMVPIAAGSFRMGSTQGAPDELPVHTVHITRPFWIGKYEVTQAEYQALMGSNPSYFRRVNRPVELVSWHGAMAYCAALTLREASAGRLPSGYQYRLATEAEWEYTCRAGTTTEWNVGSSLGCGQANFSGIPGGGLCVGQTTDVGSYAANAWGLHDTHGNVWEWCLDSWDRTANYPAGAVSDPYVNSGPYRAIRGGSWFVNSIYCRSAFRGGARPGDFLQHWGFRVVLAPVLVR